MKLKKITGLFLSFVLLVQSICAFETDQFNLPPETLADIGDEVSDYTEQNLRQAVDQVNAEILVRQSCIDKNAAKIKNIKCSTPDKERARLDFLRSNDAVALEVYKLLGSGFIPFTKSGSWMESHRFTAQPARYKTSFSKSIFFVFPIDYLTISSTVKLYDAQFGTDKVAHFFQQGYSYYKIFRRANAEGLAPDKAVQKAVRWGKMTERTFYGTLVSGVYSNADLCANYVGMKFYQNLTQPVKIGDATKPAVLRLENGVWTLDENNDLRTSLIKPFFTRHLNEALNPSIYSNLFGLRSYVRRTVRKQSCKQWLSQNPDSSQTDLEKTSASLKLWNGEDYGFTESKHFITVANTCFTNENVGDKSD